MKKFINAFGSIYLLVAVLVLFIIALVIGSLYPLSEAVEFVYNSIVFKISAIILFMALVLCLVNHYKKLLIKKVFTVIHIALIVIVAGGFISCFYSERGLVRLSIDEKSTTAIKENGGKINLPFTLELKMFDIEKYSSGKDSIHLKFLDKNFKVIEESEIEKNKEYGIPQNIDKLKIVDISKEDEAHINVLIDVNGFKRWVGTDETAYIIDEVNEIYMLLNSSNANSQVKSYKSVVEIIKDGQLIQTAKLEVSKPTSVEGYKLYQHSYDSKNKNWTGIMVKKDPGVNVVFAGYLLLIVGIFFNLFKVFASKESDNA